MKKLQIIGTITLLSMVSASVFASDVGTLTTFQADTPAVAAEVNDNFTAVKDAVDDNNARITTNEAAIATKADQTDVDANTAAIATKADQTDVDANTAAIVTKADQTDVDANTANVGANATAIGANATAIGSNTADIATNTGDIATNAADITTNTADIATNTADIATNTADISTNATNISGNTSDIADLLGGITGQTCLGNDPNDEMVRVGPLCVDKYEASVWDTASGGGTQYGAGSDDYPCDDNGSDCAGPNNATPANAIFARSEPNETPSTNITWFQAQQACAASGKRLLTNAEWQMAVTGTDSTQCNINTTNGGQGNGSVTLTNTYPSCVSNWGAVDMVGNVNEWTADWMQGTDHDTWTITDDAPSSTPRQVNSPIYASGGDAAGVVQAGTGGNYPAAVYRGGGAGGGNEFIFNASNTPSFTFSVLGFRCAR